MTDPAARVAALLEAKATARPWSALELAFFEALRGLLRQEQERLIENLLALGTAGALADATWWLYHEALLRDELEAHLTRLARLGAQAARAQLGEVSVSINWGLVNQNAVAAARQYAGELVTGIEETTRAAVREAVAEWIASGEALPALTERLQQLKDAAGHPVFDEARAQLIAQTESTSAFALGNVMAWEAAGVQPAAFRPAAHPGCRCYLQPYRLPDGARVMVWYTAHDERVCTRPVETPWGTVAGCRALHGVIVSRGAWLGQPKP